jgi:hypothetical protein
MQLNVKHPKIAKSSKATADSYGFWKLGYSIRFQLQNNNKNFKIRSNSPVVMIENLNGHYRYVN